MRTLVLVLGVFKTKSVVPFVRIGVGACKLITEKLKEDYTVKALLPSAKDYNEELMNKIYAQRKSKGICR